MKIHAIPNQVTMARLAKNLLQKELAKKIGVTPKTIMNVEKGNPVSTATAHKICVALGKKFNQLFEFRQGE